MLLGRVEVFPIKSLDAVSVAVARVNTPGILDPYRIYAVGDEAGSLINGKRTGWIHLIRTIFADDFREACFWIQGDAKKQNFVLSEPQKINQWLSAFFGFSARLVFEPNNGFPDDRVADGPTITSAGSLEEIVRWFPELTLEGT